MSEYRRDPITGHTVIVVPGRGARPNEHSVPPPAVAAQPDCPFCEGNESTTPSELAAFGRPGRVPDGRGWSVRTIPNRFPTVLADSSGPSAERGPARFETRAGFGIHEVVIESPNHAPLLPYFEEAQVLRVIRMWRDRVRALAARPGIGSVTLFENVGPDSGGSLWHPHSQLVATPGLTPSLVEETDGAERYRRKFGGECALEEVRRTEVEEGRRVVMTSEDFAAFSPFASRFPYEVRLVPARHSVSFADASDRELGGLAQRLPTLLRALLAATGATSYNFVIRSPTAPSPGLERYHWHLDIFPRILRPDGFDLGSGYHVNPVLPEEASRAIRDSLGAKR